MFGFILTNFVLPIAVKSVVKYIDSSDSKKDDKVLEVVKKGASYLADKPNNNLPKTYADVIDKCEIKKIQG